VIDRPPKVSIGLAVFNGEKYLRAAIASILAQTFTDFELILSDNASTDQTEQICRLYAAQDSRIVYHRNATNIGGANNANLTFTLSKGQYFRLAAHDDLLSPTWLEQCVAVLDRDPAVVLCDSVTALIDEQGRHLQTLMDTLATSPQPHVRFRDVAQQHNCEMGYGLMRAEVLSRTEFQPNYPESDFGFLCELSLYGQFYRVPELLFYRRHHALSSSATANIYQKMAWYDPRFNPNTSSWLDMIGCFLHLHGLEFSHYARVIWRSPITLLDRLYCSAFALRWLLSRLLLVRSRPVRQKLGLTRNFFSTSLSAVHTTLIRFPLIIQSTRSHGS
jgi:glycosyltransferase involved in cell wall biosynthesis